MSQTMTGELGESGEFGEFVLVTVTTDSREVADQITAFLVEHRLAADGQISGPIQSTYRWKGKIENTREWRCDIKTRKQLFPQLVRAVKDLHPYEVPQIVALPIVLGSRDYMDWLNDVIKCV